jgi:hypothetical protein
MVVEMQVNGAAAFRVQWLPPAVERVNQLFIRASDLGISGEFDHVCRAVEQELAQHPHLYANPLFRTQAQAGLVCRRSILSLCAHSIVYESQRAVLVHRIDPLPPHALADQQALLFRKDKRSCQAFFCDQMPTAKVI